MGGEVEDKLQVSKSLSDCWEAEGKMAVSSGPGEEKVLQLGEEWPRCMQVAPQAAPVPGVGVGLQRKQRGTSGGRLASPVSTAERGGHCSLGTPATPCLPSGRGRGGEAWGDGYFEGSKEVVTLVLRRIGEEADWRRGSQERLKTYVQGPGA